MSPLGIEEKYSFNRVRNHALKELAKLVLVPPVLLNLATRATQTRLGYWTAPCYGLAIVFGAYARTWYHDYLQGRDAKMIAGDKTIGTIPRVKGRLPGNVDIVFRLFANNDEGYLYDLFLELFDQCQSTTINLRVFGVDKYVSIDAEHIRYALGPGFRHFWLGSTRKELLENLLGDGMLNRDGDLWKTQRAMVRPFFSNDRVSDLTLFDKYAQRCMSILSDLEPGQAIDVADLTWRFTTDTASEFLFGQTLDTLSFSEADGGFSSFINALAEIQDITFKRSSFGELWPLTELFGDSTEPLGNIIKQFVNPIVQRALEHKRKMVEKGQQVEPDQSTFLEYLAWRIDDVGLIRDQLITILIAARDTTASLLAFTIYMFTQHPEVAAKARAEVLEHIGPNGTPGSNELKKLKYLQAVFNETLRLFTPLHASARESRSTGILLPPSDLTYPRGPMYLPPSSTFIYLSFLMHRNPALWGEDAHVYDPERWLDPERSQKVTANPAIFIPFSAGPRLCLGQNYALNEASVFIVRLLQRFERFALAEDKQLAPPWKAKPPPTGSSMFGPGYPGTKRKEVEKLWLGNHIVMFSKGGIWTRVLKASE